MIPTVRKTTQLIPLLNPKIFRRCRGAQALLRILSLPGLLLAITPTTARAAAEKSAAVVHERVSPPGRATEIGYFGTSPESPDGSRIAYVAYDRKPTPEVAAGSSGSLYLCDRDLTNHVKIRDIGTMRWEDGARQIWLDDNTLAYMDFLAGTKPVTYIVDKNGSLLHGPLEGYLGHGDTPHGSVLLWVDKRQYPNGSSLGPNGIYLYKGGAVTQVVDLEKDFGPLKDQLEGGDQPGEWSMFHAQLSTKGNYISIRLDTGKGVENLVTCKLDGSDVREFKTPKKPLHQQWYDDTTLFGHQRGGGGLAHLYGQRWDRDGKHIETLSGPGNHLGMSPDRKYLVSENIYKSDPVVMKLYRTGNTEPLAVLMNVPQGPVWEMKTHVNPAFSRDGRKVYFNKPVDGMPQVYRVDITKVISAGP